MTRSPATGPGPAQPFIRALGARLLGLSLALGGLAAAAALAAPSDPAPEDPAWLQQARQEVKARRFDAALAVLRPANALDNADWHNLMGFALRSRATPDLAAAEVHYVRALEIDPRHRSALEYYGELFLMKKDLNGALAMQARLERECRRGCPELDDLRADIARYRATAGK